MDRTIHRYDAVSVVSTPLNKLEALTSWISGLRSIGYTGDILEKIHKFSDPKEITKSAKLISNYANSAVGLLDQAYSGLPEISFLPLYYCLLNLSKIMIILSGKRERLFLRKNRPHGVTNRFKKSKDILFEELILWPTGTIPLLHQIITSEHWGSKEKVLKLGELYPFIQGITHEFLLAYSKPSKNQSIGLSLTGDEEEEYHLVLGIQKEIKTNSDNLRYLKVVKGFRAHPQEENTFISRKIHSQSENIAKNILLKDIRRYLISTRNSISNFGFVSDYTPLSAKRLIFPEELPIILVFFHLSSLVRYNQEFLYKVMDSKAWGMLRNLRKDSIFRFLCLFWSYLRQEILIIVEE